MSDARNEKGLIERLRTFGSDFSKWPDGAAGARAALLHRPDLRRVWDEERDLDRQLVAHRDALDREVEGSGALKRVRALSLKARSFDVFAGMSWSRIAAAVLLAGMLGGAVDLVLPKPAAESFDIAIDPYYDSDVAELR